MAKELAALQRGFSKAGKRNAYMAQLTFAAEDGASRATRSRRGRAAGDAGDAQGADPQLALAGAAEERLSPAGEGSSYVSEVKIPMTIFLLRTCFRACTCPRFLENCTS
jgi:hypothetical protein